MEAHQHDQHTDRTAARVGHTPELHKKSDNDAEDRHQSWKRRRAAAAERNDGVGEQIDRQRSGYPALNDRLQKIFEQARAARNRYAVDEKINRCEDDKRYSADTPMIARVPATFQSRNKVPNVAQNNPAVANKRSPPTPGLPMS